MFLQFFRDTWCVSLFILLVAEYSCLLLAISKSQEAVVFMSTLLNVDSQNTISG